MRNCFFLFFLLITVAAHAQVSTNVYWTTNTEQTGANVIYYDKAHPLHWPDFDGRPNIGGNVAALTTSGFGYKADMKSCRGIGEINVGVYCFFNKDKSWVKPGDDNSYILEHEQHHFDVSYIAANLFLQKVKLSGLTFANCNVLLPKIYQECCDFMDKMQDDYDGDTHNGLIVSKQTEWDNFITGKLSAVIN